MDPDVVTKSGLMVGLGEDQGGDARGIRVAADARRPGADGRAVPAPSANHLPVVRYWHPEEFADLEREAYEMGFESVASGPLVRSSYHADEQVPVRRAAAPPASA